MPQELKVPSSVIEGNQRNTRNLIDIRPMKAKASLLPQNVANLILQEPDFIESAAYFAKCEVWFRLLQAEQVGDKR